MHDKNGFCQFGLHNSNEKIELDNYSISELNVKLCNSCFETYRYEQNKDWTTAIFYEWSIKSGLTTLIPKRLVSIPKRSDLTHSLDKKLEQFRKLNKFFPTLLSSDHEKSKFIESLSSDETIIKLLFDVADKNDIAQITLRLWVGLKEAAKWLRKERSNGTLISTRDRKVGFKYVDSKALTDSVYEAGVEVAPYNELVKERHSEIYLDGVPFSSSVWRYIKYKDKKIITRSDLDEL